MFAWIRQRDPSHRPHYLWGLVLAVRTAQNLGLDKVSAVEFGVAGGTGSLALERAAEAVESLLDVTVAVYGFDTGTGMPPAGGSLRRRGSSRPAISPWIPTLFARLTRSELVLGPVRETVGKWLAADHPPVGFVAFDLDYYSSTVDAFALLDAGDARLLPRVVCYFDDLFGYGWSDFNGERAAITDFNLAHDQRKIGKIYGLKYELPPDAFQQAWPEQLYLAHILDHPLYNVLEVELSPAWFDAPSSPPR